MTTRTADESVAQVEQRISTLLDRGQVFLARDVAAESMASFPESVRLRVLFALSLIRSGAVAEAVATLKPVLARVDTKPLAAAHAALRTVLAHSGPDPGLRRRATDEPERAESRDLPLETLSAMADLVEALEKVRIGGLHARDVDPLLLLELGELHLEAWQRTCDRELLETARALLCESYETTEDVRAGAQAAAALRLLGERAESQRVARAVLARDEHADADPELAFRRLASLGIAALLAENPARAVSFFTRATDALARRSTLVVSPLRVARRLRQDGLEVPSEIDAVLKPPGVVVATGHMLDHPEAAKERFPARMETALREEIARRLEQMDVQIGYSGAACGSELLFIEALLERDGEVNVVLPFDTDDYLSTCVAFAGARWERRFQNALRLAHSVVHATKENYLGHDQLFRFQNQMLQGLSTLRAQFLDTAPHLLAVWDMNEGSLAHGAADFIDQWTDIARLQIIDIDDVRDSVPAVQVQDTPARAARPSRPALRVQPERTIRTMLFSDFVGYSKLDESAIPRYREFLERISCDLREHIPRAEVLETWGDAIFAVMAKASDLVRFAFTLKAAIERHRTDDPGRGVFLDSRISLHAGPVFPGIDPFTKRANFSGTQINRAARLEPVTVPGQIYATQHFVALLVSEECQRRHEAEEAGLEWKPIASCSYLGVMSLAKNFGRDAVYHLQPS